MARRQSRDPQRDLAETILRDCVNDDIRSWIFGTGSFGPNDVGDKQLRMVSCGPRQLRILEGVHIGRDGRIPQAQSLRSTLRPSDLLQAQVTIGNFFRVNTVGQLAQQLQAQGLPVPNIDPNDPNSLDPNGMVVAAGTMDISTLWLLSPNSPEWAKQVFSPVAGGWTYPLDITLVWAIGPFT